MTEKETSSHTSEHRDGIVEAAFREGEIQDLGTIAVESVRIQYPQPKPHFVKLRGAPLDIPRSTLENI